MRLAAYGLVLFGVALLCGCGGGGGAGSLSSLSHLSSDMTGVWQIPGLGLPNNQISVRFDGAVVVSTDGPACQTVIGNCGPTGAISLSGSWQLDGVQHSIVASGQVQSSQLLTLQATVLTSTGETIDNQAFIGGRVVGVDLPPSPPGNPEDDPEMPPPPPGDGDDDVEMPPPPPNF